jgi:ribose transport system permease protein
VQGALLGAILIATVNNGMNILNVSSYWQSLVIGLIILGGVSFDMQRRLREEKAPTAELVKHDSSAGSEGAVSAAK